MLKKHPNLWCDLAFRSEHGGDVPAEWRALFEAFPDRFMVGTDTFTPERWHYVGEHANWSRAWLAKLPAPLAEKIAWKNAEALFPARRGARREMTPRSTLTAALAAAFLAALAPASVHAALRRRAGAGVARADGERYTVAWRADPAPIPVGRHFALDVEVCPRAARRCRRARRRRDDAGAPPRHELRADGDRGRPRPLARRGPAVPHARPLGTGVRRGPGRADRIAVDVDVR